MAGVMQSPAPPLRLPPLRQVAEVGQFADLQLGGPRLVVLLITANRRSRR